MFGFKRKLPLMSTGGQLIRQVTPLSGIIEPNTEFLSLPLKDLEKLVFRYISKMETEESAEWCRCRWDVHPDDVEIRRGACRVCGSSQGSKVHSGLPEDYDMGASHTFRGKRMRRADDDPTCPVHTREGMVLYFLEWVTTDAARK